MSLRILAISDAHGAKDMLRKVLDVVIDVDAIVFCGDAAPYSNPNDVDYLFDELERKGVKSFVVPGNMDNPRAYLGKQSSIVEVIHERVAVYRGYSFIGIGGSTPTPFRTVFELSEDHIGKVLDKLWIEAAKRGPVIVVSHTPPYGTACDLAQGSMHVGSQALRKFIEDKVPLLCLCGHIHESRAVDRVGATTIVNPGPLRKGFYALVYIEGFEVPRVELRKL